MTTLYCFDMFWPCWNVQPSSPQAQGCSSWIHIAAFSGSGVFVCYNLPWNCAIEQEKFDRRQRWRFMVLHDSKKTVKFGQRLCHSAILSWLCVVVDCATEVHSRTPCHSWRGHIQARAPTWTCWRTLTMCYWRTLNCWHSWHKARRSHNLRSTCLRSDDGRTAAFEPNAISCDSYCSMFALACISANAILHPQCMYVCMYIYIFGH